jgi:hypothetical protein
MKEARKLLRQPIYWLYVRNEGGTFWPTLIAAPIHSCHKDCLRIGLVVGVDL